MLRIRSEQLAVLSMYMRTRFARSVLTEIVDAYPQFTLGLSQEEIEHRLKEVVRKWDRYKLIKAREMRAFQYLAFTVGLHFDEFPLFKSLISYAI
jgi:hypothetical protein